MLDNQEDKLQEATENQSTEQNESVEEKRIEETQEKISDEVSLESDEASSKEEAIKTSETETEKGLLETSVEETDEPVIHQSEQAQDKDSQEAADVVEKHMAEASEKQHEAVEIPMEDYESFELQDVVDKIKSLMEDHPIQAIKKHVDELKRIFNKKFGALLTEAKTKFLEEGGNTIDFHYENPVQKEYNTVLFEYKKRLKQYYQELEKHFEENLLKKKHLIEELKELIDNGEANSMYKNFKSIQERWQSIGPVSREFYSDLWRTYRFHVERFYDLLHLRNDLRDLDFKHNLEEKKKIIDKAEALAESDDVMGAFKELQILHRLWKEEIGPVSREFREEVWERFSAATKKIHDKKNEYFSSLNEVYKENLIKKEAVVQEILDFDTSGNKSHRDWQNSIKEIEKLRQKFFAIGKVPMSKNKQIWEKFKEATKVFNKKKNAYYKEIKREQLDNLNKKMKLVEQAESLRDSEDWDNVTDVMKRIQAEWKTIGHVPRKHSDKIWNRFKEACNYFFDRLHNKQEEVDAEKFEVYNAKKEYLESLKQQAEKEDFEADLNALKKYISTWRALGTVPRAQRYIDTKFNKFLDPFFEKLSLNKNETTLLRYRNMIDSWIEQGDRRKIEDEVQFVRKKIDMITKEKQQLENNILFFSNADESNPMIKNILKTVKKHEDELRIWQDKLQYLKTLEY